MRRLASAGSSSCAALCAGLVRGCKGGAKNTFDEVALVAVAVVMVVGGGGVSEDAMGTVWEGAEVREGEDGGEWEGGGERGPVVGMRE